MEILRRVSLRQALRVWPILVLFAVTSCFAQKVTVDPNVARPGATTTPAVAERYDPSKDPDKRMAQKVSYEALHARLSAVTNGLTQASGVGIVCGRSKNDWPTRDIPVTMYAKDVPLGVLLRAIARATHNIVKAEKLNNSLVYRIYQDPKLTRQFEDYEKAKEKYRQAMLSWNWDAMVAFKDIPDSEIKSYESNAATGASRISAMKKLSELLTSLGPDYKQRAMSGEPVVLDPKSLPDQIRTPLLSALGAFDRLRVSYAQSSNYRNYNAWSANSDVPGTSYVPPALIASDELEKVTLSIWVPDGSYPNMQVNAGYPVGLGLPLSPYGSVQLLHPDKVKRPVSPTPPQISEDSPYDLDFVDLKDKQVPEFQVKVDMDDLAQKKGLNYPAVMVEMAKRAGFSLIMEDWDYFKEYANSPQQWLRKGVQLNEIRYYSFKMRVDLRDKTIVPLVYDWANKHQALAPASVVDTVTRKLNGDGVDLEDLLPVMFFSLAQWDEWVQGSKDLSVLARHSFQVRDPLWQFFAALTPEDRAVAAGTDGLGLGGFDPAIITDLLARYGKFRDKQMVYSSYRPDYPSAPDEQGLAQLVLRLKSYSSPYYSSLTGAALTIPTDKVAPRGLDKTYSYSIEMSGMLEGKQQQFANSSGPYQLPFYSKDREAELIKALVGDAKPSPPAKPPPVGVTIHL